MKKTFKKAFILFMCLFAFMISTKALTLDEAAEAMENETIKFDITDMSRSSIKYFINDPISEKFKGLTNNSSNTTVNSCNDQYCETELFYYNEEEYSYVQKTVNVPIYLYGLRLESEYITASVGQEVNVKYKYTDENGKEKDIKFLNMYPYGSPKGDYNGNQSAEVEETYEEVVSIDGSKVKISKPGIYSLGMHFENGEENYWLSPVILCDPQDAINSELAKLTKFTSDISHLAEEGTIPAAEKNIVDYVFPEIPEYDIVASGSACATDNCDTTPIYNFFFEISVGNNKYEFKKNNIEIKEVGIKINEDVYPISLGENETHKIKYTSYTKDSIKWTSLDPTIATVTNEGEITALTDGAALILVNYGGATNEHIVVRVRTSKDAIKKRLQTIATDIKNNNSKLSTQTVSTVSLDTLYGILYSKIENLFDKLEDSDNIRSDFVLSNDNKTITVKLGYSYYWNLDNDADWINYCDINKDGDGYDCDVEFTLPLEYEDDKPGFDSSLISKAEELLKGLKNKIEQPSYLNNKINDYLNYNSEEDKWNVYYDNFVEGANLNSLVPNEYGFELTLDQRSGGSETGYQELSAMAAIKKDDIYYASAEKEIIIKQTTKILKPVNNTDSAILSAIETAVKSALNNKNVKVTVAKGTEVGVYTVKLVETSGENKKEIEINTYIEYTDKLPTSVSDEVDNIEITKMELSGVVEPKEGEVPQIANVKITTEGLVLKEAKWVDESTGKELSNTDKFAAKKKYILKVSFEVLDGYAVIENIGEDKIISNVKYLKAEYVQQGPDVRLYYEAKEKEIPAVAIAPTLSASNGNDNTINLSWNKVENASGFKVSRSDKKTGKYKEIADVIGSEYVDTGLTYGKVYYYKVTAYNEKNSKTSAVVSNKTVPNKVENLKVVSAGTNNVKISWDKVNVSGYEVYMGSKKVATISKSGTLTYNKTKLKANTTYKFKVRAYKKVGSKKVYGAYSEVVSVKTAPNKPSISLSTKDYKTLNVKLKSVKGATKYVIEMSTDKKTYALVEELTSSGTYAKTDLEAGKTYYFRAKVCNSENYCSGYSKVVNKKVVPATPTMSVSSSITKEVLIKVNAQEGAVGYEIYRSTKKNKGYKKVTTLTSEDEVLEYINATAKGKTYYYKVRTYVLNGTTSVYSSYSSVKKIKSK